jgi:hypothetical protein
LASSSLPATSHGVVPASDPPHAIYIMPLLPGVACLDVLHDDADIQPNKVAKVSMSAS